MGQLTKFLKGLRTENLKSKKEIQKSESAAQKQRNTATAGGAGMSSERTGTAMTEQQCNEINM